jgi:hypothetical protein
MRLFESYILLFTFCLVLFGCSSGPKPVKVTGTLLHSDKPYPVPKGGSVMLVFIPIVGAGVPFDSYPTRIKAEDSSFVLEGKAGQGIPPGKYRVEILQMAIPGTAAIPDLNERFGKDNSKIIVEVTDAKTPLVIDLAKAGN